MIALQFYRIQNKDTTIQQLLGFFKFNPCDCGCTCFTGIGLNLYYFGMTINYYHENVNSLDG